MSAGAVRREIMTRLKTRLLAEGIADEVHIAEAVSDESICGRCDGPNVVWSAPSPLWNEVIRGGDINGTEEFGGIVCPTCFAQLAEERGIASLWRLTPERVDVELQVITPSGRVWDESLFRYV